MKPGTTNFDDALARLDAYLDAAPRKGADAIHIGPFTMFVHRGPWGYYARPGSHRDVHHRFTSAEVADVLAAQREREENESLEWIHDVDPTLADAATGAGMHVIFRPLLTMDASTLLRSGSGGVVEHGFNEHGFNERGGEGAPGAGLEAPPEFSILVLGADHPKFPAIRSVAHVAFSHPGTLVGPAGPCERDAVVVDEAAAEWATERSRRGYTIAVAALDGDGELVGVGSAQPVVDPANGVNAAELTGIAVLPTHRRRGIAAAITRVLINACVYQGIETVLLSAQDDDVARVYERVGFRRVATFAEAAPEPG